MAEAFEDFGDFGEAVTGGVDLCEEFFDFGDDPFLFGNRGKWNFFCIEVIPIESGDCC